MIFFWLIFAFLLVFAAVVFIGAPYVPTHKSAVAKALDLLPLKPGDMVVDLGSGDGVFLTAAAKRGYRAVGYEVNPFLWAVSVLRSWPRRNLVKIKLANFWSAKLPPDANAIFVFLAGPFMGRLAKFLQKTMVGRTKPIFVVSYGFAVPGLSPKRVVDGLRFYLLEPHK